MTTTDARLLAETHLARFPQLAGWKIGFSTKAKRRLGVCKYRRRQILLTTSFVELNSETKVLEVILHEIAHALVGKGHGHNRTWQKQAVELGVPPSRFCQANMPKGDWRAVCGGCGRNFCMFGRPTRIRYCRQCGKEAGRLRFARVGTICQNLSTLFSHLG